MLFFRLNTAILSDLGKILLICIAVFLFLVIFWIVFWGED